VSGERQWSPQELALATLTILLVAALLYLALSNMSMGVPKELALELGLCYTRVSADGPKLVVEGACFSEYGVYAGGGLAPACPSAACKRLSVSLSQPVAEVAVATNDANATLRAVRLPGGAYALETPHGLVQAFCFRG